MPIDPRLTPAALGTTAGSAQRLQDLARRLGRLEAVRSTVGAGTIGGVAIAPGAIDTSHIVAGSITAALISAGAINAGMIQANAIQTVHLTAGAVTAAKIAAGTITSNEIAAGTITAAKIAADTITSNEIAANAITTTELAAGAVTAGKISVSTLSAISTDMGSISAGTITGATIQTAASGSRVLINSTGIKGYALDGTTVNFDFNTGSGIATVKGIIVAQAAGSSLPATYITGSLGGGNLLFNSSVENYPGSWLGFQGTLASETGVGNYKYGTKSLKFTGTVAGTIEAYVQALTQVPRVEPGKTYTFSLWVKAGNNVRNCRVMSRFLDAAGTVLPGPSPNVWNFVTGAQTATSTAAWTRLVATGVAPANAVYSGIVFDCSTAVIGDIFYLDGFQIEESDVASSYAPRPDEILPDTIVGPELQAGSVTTAKMTANTIAGDRIQAGTMTADRITAGTISSLQIATGAISADSIAAGAIEAQHLSISTNSLMGVVKNGTFTQGSTGVDDLDLTSPGFLMDEGADMFQPAFDHWFDDVSASGVWTVEADSTFTRAAKVVLATSGNAYRGQSVELPKGRNVIRAWVKLTSVVGATAAGITVTNVSGSVTITNPTYTTGTTDWLLQESIVNVTSATAIVRVYLQLGSTATGTAQFANVHSLSSVTTTEIGPGTIVTNHMTANTIDGTVITAGTLDATKITALSITSAQLQAGSITTDKIAFRYAGNNLAKNSSFEQGIGNVTAVNGTVAIGAFPRTGLNAVVATVTTAGTLDVRNVVAADLVTPITGTAVTITAWVKAPTAARTMYIRPYFYTSANAFVSGTPTGSPPTLIDTQVTSSATYQRVRFTFPFTPGTNGVPATAAKMGWAVLAAAATVGEVFHIDDVQIEFGDTPSDWSQYIDPTVIDGSTITAPIIQTSTTNPKLRLDGTNGLFLTDAAGTTVAQFKAGGGGLDLTASTSSTMPPPTPAERKLRFLDAGVSFAELYGNASTGSRIMEQVVLSTSSAGNQGIIEIRATDPVASYGDHASILLNHTKGTPNSNTVQAQAGTAISETVQLVAGGGGSSFLKLATVDNRYVAFGTTAITLTAQESNTTTVTHGLGTTPLVVIATCRTDNMLAFTGTHGATTFVLGASFKNTGNITGTVDVDWIAIG